MNKKPGWAYYYSDVLQKKFAIHESGWVRFEDGVMYSPEEVQLIGHGGCKLEPAVHDIKLFFKGEVIKSDVKVETKTAIIPIIDKNELDIW
jgi:hypothetical protein